MTKKTELPAARTRAPDVKDNQLTAHLSLSLSPPLQITRDTRAREEKSNEDHISWYTEAMQVQHQHNITSQWNHFTFHFTLCVGFVIMSLP